MKTHYIYHLRDPRDGSVRYVGKSTNPRARLRQHLKDAQARAVTDKQQWLRQLAALKLQPTLIIAGQYADEAAARIAESDHLHRHRATALNIHDPRKGAGDLRPARAKR